MDIACSCFFLMGMNKLVHMYMGMDMDKFAVCLDASPSTKDSYFMFLACGCSTLTAITHSIMSVLDKPSSCNNVYPRSMLVSTISSEASSLASLVETNVSLKRQSS